MFRFAPEIIEEILVFKEARLTAVDAEEWRATNRDPDELIPCISDEAWEFFRACSEMDISHSITSGKDIWIDKCRYCGHESIDDAMDFVAHLFRHDCIQGRHLIEVHFNEDESLGDFL